jgi:hypothetical protein
MLEFLTYCHPVDESQNKSKQEQSKAMYKIQELAVPDTDIFCMWRTSKEVKEEVIAENPADLEMLLASKDQEKEDAAMPTSDVLMFCQPVFCQPIVAKEFMFSKSA